VRILLFFHKRDCNSHADLAWMRRAIEKAILAVLDNKTAKTTHSMCVAATMSESSCCLQLDSNMQLQNISKLKVNSYQFTDEFVDYAGLPDQARRHRLRRRETSVAGVGARRRGL